MADLCLQNGHGTFEPDNLPGLDRLEIVDGEKVVVDVAVAQIVSVALEGVDSLAGLLDLPRKLGVLPLQDVDGVHAVVQQRLQTSNPLFVESTFLAAVGVAELTFFAPSRRLGVELVFQDELDLRVLGLELLLQRLDDRFRLGQLSVQFPHFIGQNFFLDS